MNFIYVLIVITVLAFSLTYIDITKEKYAEKLEDTNQILMELLYDSQIVNSMINEKKQIQKIYSIKTDKNGFPKFLVFENNQWSWKSAKKFKPIIEEMNRLCDMLYEEDDWL